MVKLGKGGKNKRETLKHKYKVVKKVREHKRKMRKESKKARVLGLPRKNMEKDLHIPNLYPFKQKLLDSIERKKVAEEKKKQIEKLKKRAKNKEIIEGVDGLGIFAEKAKIDIKKYEDIVENKRKMEELKASHPDAKELIKTKRSYKKITEEVIEASEVLLEVLDARDPLGCRSKELEEMILSKGKHLVFILNKIDLISKNNAEDWKEYLKQFHPTLLFRGNLQGQQSNLSGIPLHASLSAKNTEKDQEIYKNILKSSKSVGGQEIVGLLKNYSRTPGGGNVKLTISVGVIGFPNVGKSTLINSLKREKVAAVANTPGLTKHIQEIYLDKNLRLLDCPGVIFSKENADSLILRNVIKVENMVDPFRAVDKILEKVDGNELQNTYEIGPYRDTQHFLALLAKRRGRLLKGGVPDYDMAARLILTDWNAGQIKYESNIPNNTTGEDADNLDEVQIMKV